MDLLRRFREAGENGGEFRSAPLWSWNDDLDPRELRRQIREMKLGGLGGHFMHARVGLGVPYMGEEWMECVRASAEESAKQGMKAWLYDEDCWPSGTAGGVVPAKGEEYLQKRLECVEVERKAFGPQERTIATFAAWRHEGKLARFERLHGDTPPECDTVVVFRYATTAYVDLLSEKVVTAFIEASYQPYYQAVGEHFGEAVPGIFTDEPQYASPPWSLDLPAFFQERIGYDLVEALPCLFYELGDFVKVRYDYLRAVTMRFVENFSRRIGRWCAEHNVQFTGHLNAEDTLTSQVRSVGAVMPHYVHMQQPGIDLLCRGLSTTLLCKGAASVAHQLGGRRVLSEMYACSGWNASMEELKWIGEWQYVLGIDFPCPHVAHYSLRGCRKRDYPPSLHYQQPYWPSAYKRLNDHVARLLAALTSGEHQADILLIHAIGSAWAAWHPSDNTAMDDESRKFEQLSTMLLEMHRDFDYGDEMLLAEYASVEGDTLRVGSTVYSVVIVPPMRSIFGSTLRLLREFMAAGGRVIVMEAPPERVDGERTVTAAEALAACKSCKLDKRSLIPALDKLLPRKITVRAGGKSAPTIYCQHRREGAASRYTPMDITEGGAGWYVSRDASAQHVFFFANTSKDKAIEAEITLPFVGEVSELDMDTAAARAIPVDVADGQVTFTLDFPEMGSHLVMLDENAEPLAGEPLAPFGEDGALALDGQWTLERVGPNALTLDRCRYRIGSTAKWSEPIEVIHLQRMLAEKGKSCDLTMQFEFESEITGRKRHFELVMESPQRFATTVNGTSIPPKDRGWWRDISFRRINIAPYVIEGMNVIELATRFDADADAARKLRDPALHESVKNRLRAGTELESVYIIGDFGVRSKGGFDAAERRALWTPGPFVITDESYLEEPTNLVDSGFPFFAGTVVLWKWIEWEPKEGRVFLELGRPDAIAARVRINGQAAGELLWAPWRVEVTELIEPGPNEIVIELTNSCRNLLGPHHHPAGELFAVGPGQFADSEPDWLDKPGAGKWDDRYCFVRFGTGQAPRVVWGR